MPRLAVIGHPVAHSRSPAMQNAALAELGLAAEWSYEAIDVAPEDFEARVRAMAGEGYAASTSPCRTRKRRWRWPTRRARRRGEIGAANTLSFGPTAEIERPRTPTPAGCCGSCPAARAGERALVLGAGGAARAAIWALARRAPRSRSGTAPPARAAERGRRPAARGASTRGRAEPPSQRATTS